MRCSRWRSGSVRPSESARGCPEQVKSLLLIYACVSMCEYSNRGGWVRGLRAWSQAREWEKVGLDSYLLPAGWILVTGLLIWNVRSGRSGHGSPAALPSQLTRAGQEGFGPALLSAV
jgi:hypothetical protein